MIDPIQLCPTCQIVKTPRSKHCNLCNQCVERWDHHCPWINNCVGVVNHIYFFLFLSFLTLHITILLLNTGYMLYIVIQNDRTLQELKIDHPIAFIISYKNPHME